MPKVSREELEAYLDPDSDQYIPSREDMERDDRLLRDLYYELTALEYELVHPGEDYYTGEKNKFGAADPESCRDRLETLRRDQERVKDPDRKREIQKHIADMEKKIYRQYIPFIESKIYQYAWQHSPSERYRSEYKMMMGELTDLFRTAESILDELALSEDERAIFLNELESLKERLDRYLEEPNLFTFESIEEKLQTELNGLSVGFFYSRRNEDYLVLEYEPSRVENQRWLESLFNKVRTMREVVSRMTNDEIKSTCSQRADSLLEYLEFYKANSEAPREFATMEAGLRDLINRKSRGEQIDASAFEYIGERLQDLQDSKIGNGLKPIFDKLTFLYFKAQRMLPGETLDEDEMRFDGATRGVDWAWDILGVARSAPPEEVKREYRRLVKKYYPANSTRGDHERMKNINEAYGMIMKSKGLK